MEVEIVILSMDILIPTVDEKDKASWAVAFFSGS